MLAVIVIILFQPPSALPQGTILPVHKSRLRDVPSAETTNIKEALLEKINKYSVANGNKFDMLEAIETDESNGKLAETLGQSLKAEGMEVQKLGALPDPFLASSFQDILGRKAAILAQLNRANANGREIELPQDQLAQQSAEENDRATKDVRDWRMRFYKAFRNSRQQQKIRSEGDETSWTTAKIDPQKLQLQTKKDSSPFENIKSDAIADDWATFLSVRSASPPDERRSSPPLPPGHAFEIERSGYQYNTSFPTLNTYLPYAITTPSPSPLPFYQSYQHGITVPPSDYSQSSDPVYVPETGFPYSSPRDYDRLPPAPNPKSTEASVHAVQVPAPPATPYYTDSAPHGYYTSQVGTPIHHNRQQVQLLSEYDPRVFTTREPIRSPEMHPPQDYTQDSLETVDDDNFATYPADEIHQAQVHGPAAPAVAALNAPFHPDERCNSANLRAVMIINMVENDSESSKRAVQMAAENAFGKDYNVVCGTGFFSYVAHTDEFCMVSMSNVNCYTFAPICSHQFVGLKKAKVAKTKVLLNKS